MKINLYRNRCVIDKNRHDFTRVKQVIFWEKYCHFLRIKSGINRTVVRKNSWDRLQHSRKEKAVKIMDETMWPHTCAKGGLHPRIGRQSIRSLSGQVSPCTLPAPKSGKYTAHLCHHWLLSSFKLFEIRKTYLPVYNHLIIYTRYTLYYYLWLLSLS